MKDIDFSDMSFKKTKFQNKQVQEKFAAYPMDMQKHLLMLRHFILDCSDVKLEETLKWGEPSYISPQGSTIRIDYKTKSPQQYAMYFNCKTKLLDTFKEIYPDEFIYEGNRAIIFLVTETINVSALQNCINMALNYHNIKHLPLLGGQYS